MVIWQWICHALGFDYGLPYGHLGFYNMWSGFGSDLGEVAIVGGLAAIVRRHNCHVHHCWRLGRHSVEGTPHLVCRHHHPDGNLTPQGLLDAHKAAALAADGPVKGGVGSNPAEVGLPAETADDAAAGSVVPPPAATRKRQPKHTSQQDAPENNGAAVNPPQASTKGAG